MGTIYVYFTASVEVFETVPAPSNTGEVFASIKKNNQ
jgi:hypothetical protein